MIIRIAFTLVFLLIYGTSHSQTCQQNVNHPGYKTVSQTISGTTIEREYILHVPETYDEVKPTPLVINMHGFGDCAASYAETIGDFYNFNDLANKENFLVAYPQGAYRPEKEDNYWEPGDNGEDDIYENDIYFIEQLVADISAEYNVEQNKVYACGYSNGGMMAYSLACNSNDLFSAIGIMSGTMLEEDCMAASPVPMIIFHGIADGVLPYDGGIWYQSVSDIVDFWLDKNNLPASSMVSYDFNDGNVIRDHYFAGDDNSCMTLYTINEEFDKPGDHVWFSEPIDGTSPNELLWNFMNENCTTLSGVENASSSDFIIDILPNPFTQQLTIESENAIGQNFRIIDLHGKTVSVGEINSSKQIIDLSTLPANVYIINIGGEVRKLVKTQ